VRAHFGKQRVVISVFVPGAPAGILSKNRTGAGGTIGIDTAIKSPPERLFGASHQRQRGQCSACDAAEHRLPQRPAAGLSARPSAPGPCRASLDRSGEFGRRPGRAGEAAAGHGVRDLGSRFEPARAVGMVREAGRPQVRSRALSRRGPQAINDLIAGHVQIGVLGPTALIPHYKAGTLRLLAQSGEKRSRSLPEVPTLLESGFAGLTVESWYAAFVPLGTPAPVIARLNAVMNKALADPATREIAT
jgi:hypothetical protein